MSKRLWLISVVLLLCMAARAAGDSIYTEQASPSHYDKRIHRYREHWGALIPTQFVVQNAGNMGWLSAGLGWDYGHRRRWETHLLFGFIPKHQTSRAKLTMTLKENFIPWSHQLKRGFHIEPLTVSLYFNTVYGHEFWKSQPHRYPDKYYDFMSTKFRVNVALGQRFTIDIPQEKRRTSKSISLFYEVSTCDLYLRTFFQDRNVHLGDILGLSIGVKFQSM